jgi:hypothetical protein
MRVDLRVLFVLAALATTPGRLAAQNDMKVLGRRAVSPTVAIKAWNAFGSFTFIGWDKDSVVMRGRVSRSRKVLFAGKKESMMVGAEGSFGDDDASRSDLVVYIPRRAQVYIKSVEADITVTDVSGTFFTTSGNVRVNGSATSISVETIDGNIDLNVNAPWVKAQTSRGHLLLRGAAQDADLSTVGGTMSIASSSVLRGRFSSVDGDIHYAATPARGAIFEFSNHAGAVDLLMPLSTSAAFGLTTVSGDIENGFTNVRPVSASLHSMRISLGRGEAQISVRTFKGVIRLRPQQ